MAHPQRRSGRSDADHGGPPHTGGGDFVSLAQAIPESDRKVASLMPGVWHRSEAMTFQSQERLRATLKDHCHRDGHARSLPSRWADQAILCQLKRLLEHGPYLGEQGNADLGSGRSRSGRHAAVTVPDTQMVRELRPLGRRRLRTVLELKWDLRLLETIPHRLGGVGQFIAGS